MKPAKGDIAIDSHSELSPFIPMSARSKKRRKYIAGYPWLAVIKEWNGAFFCLIFFGFFATLSFFACWSIIENFFFDPYYWSYIRLNIILYAFGSILAFPIFLGSMAIAVMTPISFLTGLSTKNFRYQIQVEDDFHDPMLKVRTNPGYGSLICENLKYLDFIAETQGKLPLYEMGIREDTESDINPQWYRGEVGQATLECLISTIEGRDADKANEELLEDLKAMLQHLGTRKEFRLCIR